MFCPKCGSQNDDNAFKCIYCGTIMQAVPPPLVTAKQSNTPIVILFVVIGIFVGIVILGILAAIAIPQFHAYRMRSYDAQAQIVLQQACVSAHEFFMQYPDQNLTMEALAKAGLIVPPTVEFAIENGSAKNFVLTARHQRGRKTFTMDGECQVQTVEPSAS